MAGGMRTTMPLAKSAGTSGGMRRGDGRWAGLFLAPYLLFFVVFTLTPVLYGFWISLHDWHVLSRTVPFVGLTNYRVALGDDLFRIAVARTALFALMVVPAGNIASLGLAMMLNGITRGGTLFKVAYYVPVVTSITATAIIWRLLYAADGLLNHALNADLPWLASPDWALPSIVLMSVWWGAGGNMLVYLAALKAVPKEQLEAASLDGAAPAKRFRHVTIPNIRGVIVFCLVMSVIGASQIFAQTLILTNGGPADSTLTVMLYMYRQGIGMYQLGYGSAIAYILFAGVFLLGLTQIRSMSKSMQSD
ncbi:sugar ABC transporter permease [bacterium]|nr:MAG: sugar ABC transporter permease [bacterium]